MTWGPQHSPGGDGSQAVRAPPKPKKAAATADRVRVAVTRILCHPSKAKDLASLLGGFPLTRDAGSFVASLLRMTRCAWNRRCRGANQRFSAASAVSAAPLESTIVEIHGPGA